MSLETQQDHRLFAHDRELYPRMCMLLTFFVKFPVYWCLYSEHLRNVERESSLTEALVVFAIGDNVGKYSCYQLVTALRNSGKNVMAFVNINILYYKSVILYSKST